LLKVTDNIARELDMGNFTALTLLDFSKAFDSLDYNILCNKLNSIFRFSPRVCNFIRSFLNGRSQAVKVNNNYSSPLNILSGITQGSVTGPLFFCLFINDLPDVCHHSNVHMYADDVQIYYSRPIGLLEDCVYRVNEDLERISQWATRNNLKLNPAKSVCLPIYKSDIHLHSLPSVILNNCIVPYVDSIFNLGVNMNRKLTCDIVKYYIE